MDKRNPLKQKKQKDSKAPHIERQKQHAQPSNVSGMHAGQHQAHSQHLSQPTQVQHGASHQGQSSHWASASLKKGQFDQQQYRNR
jgi:hypothetical protein